MKELIVKPRDLYNEVIVQYSDSHIVDKHIFVEVPKQYEMIAYIDGQIKYRENEGTHQVIKKNKDFKNKEFKAAFIQKKALPDIIWGFGNINVNNERLKECYRIGANGTLQFEIEDRQKIADSFPWGNDITVEMIKEKIMPSIKNVGADLLSTYFANTSVSVFEINSKLDEIRVQLVQSFTNDPIIKDMGLKIKSLTVNPIHVNDEDLDVIRNRING